MYTILNEQGEELVTVNEDVKKLVKKNKKRHGDCQLIHQHDNVYLVSVPFTYQVRFVAKMFVRLH